MNDRPGYTLGQLLALCSITALTPALRLLPSLSAELAGQGGWLSILLALPVAALYGALLWRFRRTRTEGESIPALWRRAAGPRAGAVLLALAALWLLFNAAFTLRDSAQRLIGTVYPYADRRLFILPLGLLAAAAGSGNARRLTRTAKLVLPLSVGAILLTLLFALPEIDPENLLPLRLRGAELLRGALPTLETACLILALLFFLSDGLEGELRYRSVVLRLCLLGGLMAALTAAVIGAFGHELTARLTQPYFSLVRDLVLFRTLERMEALLVALWIFSDFLLSASLLLIARHFCEELLGRRIWLAALLGAASVTAACFLAPEAESFRRLSFRLVPGLNAAFCLLLIPGVFALGSLRKKL